MKTTSKIIAQRAAEFATFLRMGEERLMFYMAFDRGFKSYDELKEVERTNPEDERLTLDLSNEAEFDRIVETRRIFLEIRQYDLETRGNRS
jgi:hypothetical protein